MAVVGFDVGNYASYIGLARAGGVEILTNEYSERQTPTYVSIQGIERAMGQAAKQQEINNVKNTYRNFKRLVGRSFSDPFVQREISYLPFELSSGEHDSILVKATYGGEKRYFTPQQLYAMMLTKLRSIAGIAAATRIVDCVISTPLFTTDLERRALIEASQIAELNCMRLFNDSAAIALNYGMYKVDLPAENEPARVVVFVDMGYAALQVSAVAFNKGKLQVLGASFDNFLGGRDFDMLIVDLCRQDIQKRFKVDVKKNIRGWLRLQNQCERAKKMMSTISTPVPIDVECLINDEDYHTMICRNDFEDLCGNLLQRVKAVFEELLAMTQLDADRIHSVEIVGGSTRIPAVKQLVKQVFKKEVSTTLNADEAVARGCTLMCAIMSPSFRVKEIRVEDRQPFPITLSWKGSANEDTAIEIITNQNNFPVTRMVTFNKSEPFTVEARYSYPNNIPYPDARIGYFIVENIKPDKKGNPSKIKLKVRMNRDGILEINHAQMFESVDGGTEAVEEEAQQTEEGGQTEEAKKTEEKPTGNETPEQPTENHANEEKAAAPPKVGKKVKTKTIELPVVTKIKQLSGNQLRRLQEEELEMQATDRKEREKADARNAVEEYIYEMRDKLAGTYAEYTTADVKAEFLKQLDNVEDWLYNTDKNTEKSSFVQRLNKLKAIGDPIVHRYREYRELPTAIDGLRKSLQHVQEIYTQWYNKDEKYSHLSNEDMEKVYKAITEKQQWMADVCRVLSNAKHHVDPNYSSQQVKQAKQDFESVCLPIVRKQKPAASPAPPPPGQNNSAAAENPGTADAKDEQPHDAPVNQNNESMDVD